MSETAAPSLSLSPEHRAYLRAAAITDDVIDASGAYTREAEPAGIVFLWNDGTTELPQLRPDSPQPDENGRPKKYVFPTGSTMILNRVRDTGEGPVIICEGTKQQYTCASYAPEDHAVYGMAGCWCWTDADLTWVMDRDVFVLLDGDFTTNKDVHQAATELRDQLDACGASSVRFVRTSARGSDGLDDVLARVDEDKRAKFLALWLGKASDKLPKVPSKKETNPFFDKGGLQVQKATEFLLENQPAALTAERKVALYLGGSYHIDGTAFLAAVGKQLGDQFRPAWRSAMEEMAVGVLFAGGKMLPERSPHMMLNVANGMLDLRTLQLEPHGPSFMSTIQIPVEWLPDAQAPVYEAWLASSAPGQGEDLEEVAGTMLDPTRTPHKAAFLFGPSRSGKSTFLRIMQAIAGTENRTSVTLHDLSRDRFAAANVYGKMLNSAADLSSAHVEDLSVFKMMTGEDAIHGNRKYGAQFTFTNQALFAFSANELPTVSESSRAYAERIKPFEFPHSFAGREDPGLEAKLREELPGILVRWVKAYRRVLERGGYTRTDERVRKEFETRSDRVAQWVADVCMLTEAVPGAELPDHQCTGRRESAALFNRWAERNGGSKMGERKIFDRLGHIPGVVEVRSGRNRSRAFNLVVKDNPDADLRVSPEPPKQRAETRVDRAVSDHPSHTPSNHPSSNDDQGVREVEVHGEGAPEVPALPAPDQPPGPDLQEQARALSESASARLPDDGSFVAFDLETLSADRLHTAGRGEFVRLIGLGNVVWTAGVTGAATMSGALNAAPLVGHNNFFFDCVALDRHHGFPVEKTVKNGRDLRIAAFQNDPPTSYETSAGPGFKSYSLDALGERYLNIPKSELGKALAKEYGGWDSIPADDPRYVQYCRDDVELTRKLDAAIPYDPYEKREAAVCAITARATLSGFRVDVAGLQARADALAAQRDTTRQMLAERYGFPLLNKQGKEAAAPQRTAAGKQAIEAALSGVGFPVDLWPRGKDDSLSLSKDTMAFALGHARKHVPAALPVIEAVSEMNGIRNNAANVLRYVVGDRVHPAFLPFQATGRWSVLEPGLTVLKKGSADSERAFLLPEEDEVLVSIDLDQIDIRCVAAHSQDPNLIAILNDPGRDIHSEISTLAFGTAEGKARHYAKSLDLGWLYGRGIRGMVENTPGVTMGAAGRVDSSMREQFGRVLEWQSEVRELGSAGVLLDNGFGRRLRVDPDRSYTQAPAMLGQSTTRDLIAEGLLDLARTAPEVIPMLRVIVHDEVVASVPRQNAEEIARIIQSSMSRMWAPAGASRPVRVSAGQGKPFVFGEKWSDLYA